MRRCTRGTDVRAGGAGLGDTRTRGASGRAFEGRRDDAAAGGGVAAADARLVVIDGLPSPDPHPDVSDHEERALNAKNLSAWLEHRRSAGSLQRKPGTLEELAKRRKRMNPRLSDDWLRYLVTVGARRDSDGWPLHPAGLRPRRAASMPRQHVGWWRMKTTYTLLSGLASWLFLPEDGIQNAIHKAS
jgi:hypothetical protein